MTIKYQYFSVSNICFPISSVMLDLRLLCSVGAVGTVFATILFFWPFIAKP